MVTFNTLSMRSWRFAFRSRSSASILSISFLQSRKTREVQHVMHLMMLYTYVSLDRTRRGQANRKQQESSTTTPTPHRAPS